MITVTCPSRASCICFALLVLGAAPASAQNVNRLPNRGEPTNSITLETETPGVPLSVRIQIPESQRCSAVISLSYAQRDTYANVEGELNNMVCGASSGDYILAVSIRDATGATRTLDFTEVWQRQDSQKVVFEMDYPIGKDVDLLRVRPRRINCTCTEPAETSAASD